MEQSAEPAGGTATPITPGLLPGSRTETSTRTEVPRSSCSAASPPTTSLQPKPPISI